MAESRTPLSYQPRKQRQWRVEAAAEWHRFASRFTREAVISNLKTLAWVVPLTLLIWIYAEREQVASMKDVAVPFDLVSVDPNAVVSNTTASNVFQTSPWALASGKWTTPRETPGNAALLISCTSCPRR